MLPSLQGNVGMAAVARQMRRLFGPAGGAVRQDVLAATGVDEQSKAASDDDDFEALVSYRNAKKSSTEKESTWAKKGKAGENTGDGEIPNGTNSKMGTRDRCYLRKSKNYLVPKCPQRGRLGTGTIPASSPPDVSARPPCSSIS